MDDRLPTVIDSVLLASRVLVGVAARSLAELEDQCTLPQFRALVVLAAGECRLGDLAEALDIRPSSATRLCGRLEAKELITRTPSEQSRRELCVALTPTGRSLVDTVTRRRRREIARIVGRISDRDQRVLIHALGVFAEAAGEKPEPSWSFGWEKP